MNTQLRLTLVITAAILLLIGGCKKWYKYDEMTLVKQLYNGTELRLDGYYYDMEDGQIWGTYFFYQDGTILYGIGTDTLDKSSLEEHDAWFSSDYFRESIKTDRRRWGLFEIQDDSIALERWGIVEWHDPVLHFSGQILNDTTFIITRCENPHTGSTHQYNDLYHFHQFSPKPDSTNTFIP